MNLLFELILGFWIIIPAYAANGFAPLARGRRRIDFGKKFGGRDILGPGKTWEGLALALVVGTLFGALELYLYSTLNPIALEAGFSLQKISLLSVFFVALGAMSGDMIGSLFKRRLGMERGESAPLLDQLDFLLVAFLFASFFVPVSLPSVIIFMFITPLVHYLSSFIGYKLGLKEVPW
jgi:CDP-2,3-bis-(O-geranylgeranyl)-sn-glycerol synthase